MRHNIKLLALTLLFPLLTACGNAAAGNQATCAAESCSEAELNAPVAGSVEDSSLPAELTREDSALSAAAAYKFPAFTTAWGLRRAAYDKAVAAHAKNKSRIKNGRYAVVIDMAQHSSIRRLFLFDLSNGNVKRQLVSHGEGSDKNNDGYATEFSNEDSSHMSSLGAYITDSTYIGKNGYSLRLRGQDSTNSNAYARAVVMHPADYVRESAGKAGRSWGCPAMDPAVSRGVIDKMKGGAFLFITR
jgi:hypothetical protein